jgi:hypothetical protein
MLPFLGLIFALAGQAAPLPPPPTSPPGLVFAFQLRAELGPVMEVGQVPRGRRRIVPIVGGVFEGPGLKGKVLNHGADWQIVRADGFTEIDTRYELESDQGQLIYVQNVGMRHAAPEILAKLAAGEAVDPNVVYFRTVPTFETSAPELQWLTRSIFVGIGERHPSSVIVKFFRVQ